MIGAATIQSIVGHLTGYKPRWLTIMIGDAHVYVDQFAYLDEMLTKEPLKLPTLKIADHVPAGVPGAVLTKDEINEVVSWLDKIEPADLVIENYEYHALKTPVPKMAV